MLRMRDGRLRRHLELRERGLGRCRSLFVLAVNPPLPSLADVIAAMGRRAARLDEIREALEELRAEGAAACCHKGCAGCPVMAMEMQCG
jgi:hypothetical protein